MSAVNLLAPALGAGMGIISRAGGAGVGCTRPVAWQTPRDTCQGAGCRRHKHFGFSVPMEGHNEVPSRNNCRVAGCQQAHTSTTKTRGYVTHYQIPSQLPANVSH